MVSVSLFGIHPYYTKLPGDRVLGLAPFPQPFAALPVPNMDGNPIVGRRQNPQMNLPTAPIEAKIATEKRKV